MILHRHRLKSATTEVTLCPLGDIQWAGEPADIAYDHLEEHIVLCLAQPTPLFIGAGDYIDFASPTMRDALAKVNYDTAQKVITDAVRALVDDLYARLLKPTRGKWLGLVQGHHHYGIGPPLNIDSDQHLATLLKTTFLEEFGYVKLEFGGPEYTVNFIVFHGSGSSVFPWGPLNRLYRLAPNFTVDFLMMGHQTKKATADFDRIEFPDAGPDRLEHRSVRLFGTGGWSKGYINGRPTYVSRAAMNPVALGQPLVHIRPRFRTSTDGGKVWDPRITIES